MGVVLGWGGWIDREEKGTNQRNKDGDRES